MASKPTKPDETLAPKLVRKSLQNTGRVLYFIGKPLYAVFSSLAVAVLFLLFLIGAVTRLSLVGILRLLTALTAFVGHTTYSTIWFITKRLFTIKLPKIPKIKAPKLPKITPVKIKKPTFSKLNVLISPFRKNLKLTLLRVKIQIERARKVKIKLKLPSPRLRPFIAIAVFLLFISFLGTSFWWFVIKDLPSAQELVSRDLEVSTKIYDRNGRLLYKIYKDKNRTPVELTEIPTSVRLATIAIEDAEFYYHPGFSVRGMARAIITNLRRGELAGGSTITQQLVKNALLSSEKTLTRKLRELILAVGVELNFTKDQILEMYLNEVSYAGTAYGIQEASRVYFGKNVDRLSLAEAALLAGLPKSPSRFSPFGPNPELAKERQKEVINLMVVNGFVTAKQAEVALDQELVFAPNRVEIDAPHFVMYVREILAQKYSEEVVETGGLNVITTLDYSIQKLAEEVVSEEIAKIRNLNVSNGAALVINPKTGEILAMVGSKDYFDTASDGNVNVTTRLRQPGSSIKVVNYAYALSNGYTPASILSDTPVTFAVPGQPPYSPKNYDDKFRGRLSLRSALAESRNVPAVKVLASYGVPQMLEMGQKMGITTWNDPSHYGLSLTLGGGDVKLVDLANVYATIANYGNKNELSSLIKITNYKGNIIEENLCLADKMVTAEEEALQTDSALAAARPAKKDCEAQTVLDPKVAFLLINILSDNEARAPAFGRYSQLVIADHDEVAVKTGTSNDLRDNLTLGFTQDFLVAVWVGNNDNSPMARVASGVTGASPIFNKIMTTLLAEKPNHDWFIPQGLIQLPVCSLTGTLSCEGCRTRTEWFLDENKPNFSCSPEQIKAISGKRQEASGPEGLWPEGGQILPDGVRTGR